MEIQLNEDYRIKSDERNVIVERRHIVDPTKSPNWPKLAEKGADPSPRIEWREVSYHSTVPQAVKAIGEQNVRDSEAETLSSLLAEIRAFHGEMRELFRTKGTR